MFETLSGYPLHRENRVNGQKKIPVRENREFENFAKTQGIWSAQVENSLILNVKDILIFVTKISKKNGSLISLPSQFCVCYSHKSHKLA